MSHSPALDTSAGYNRQAAESGWPSYCDDGLSFDSSDLAAMLLVWREVAGPRAMPARSDLTARLIKAFLPYITIYERFESERGKARYRVRLMGTAFAQVYGDLTGKIIDEVVPSEMVPRFQYAIDETLGLARPLRFLARVDMQQKAYFVAEYLMAPLAADNGKPTMVLSHAHFSARRSWNEVARDIEAGRRASTHA